MAVLRHGVVQSRQAGWVLFLGLFSACIHVRKWQEVSEKDISLELGDICDWESLSQVQHTLYSSAPLTAPYSMIDRQRPIYTQTNNGMRSINLTHLLNTDLEFLYIT